MGIPAQRMQKLFATQREPYQKAFQTLLNPTAGEKPDFPQFWLAYENIATIIGKK
jgi:hypothetical protein